MKPLRPEERPNEPFETSDPKIAKDVMLYYGLLDYFTVPNPDQNTIMVTCNSEKIPHYIIAIRLAKRFPHPEGGYIVVGLPKSDGPNALPEACRKMRSLLRPDIERLDVNPHKQSGN